MPIAYFLLVLTAFFFSRNHLPFASLILLLGLAVLLVDIIIQIVRFTLKRTPLTTFLASITLTFIAVGCTFTWMFWPGVRIVSVFGLLIAVGFVGYWLKVNAKPTTRFIITMLMMMILGILTTMKTSAVYSLKNDIDPENPATPVFIRHNLAWLYNVEGNYDASMRMLLIEKKYLESRLAEAKTRHTSEFYVNLFEQDLKIVYTAIVDLSRRSWEYYEPLLPEDFLD